MDRRGFLKLLGSGVAIAATPAVLLVEPEPVRRYWQVPRNAPVGRPVAELLSGDAYERILANMREHFNRDLEVALLYGKPIPREHGFTYHGSGAAFALQRVVLTPRFTRDTF